MGLAQTLKNRLGYVDWTAPATDGDGAKSHAPTEAKSTTTVGFFSPDSLRTLYRLPGLTTSDVDEVSRETAFAAAIYAYAAMTWRAEKYSEPPLMVTELSDEDEDEWLPDHDLAGLLEHPHPDLDMGELLYQTRLYRDGTGGCLWVKDADRIGRIARLTPFSAEEFEPRRANGRMFGAFRIRTRSGQETLPAERCVYFREPGPSPWGHGVAPLDVALQALNIGKQATATVKDILRNALFPSIIVQAHPEWQPTDEEFDKWNADLAAHAERAKRGGALGLQGGGTATVVSQNLKNLMPDEVLDRVESSVAAAFRVPPIVLQFKVGLENSPWSQMEEARRSVTQDLLVPMWTRDAKKLTAQLLRSPADEDRQPVDDDPKRHVRFDTSDVAALQPDRRAQAETAEKMSIYARVKDLRQIAGLEPLEDSDPRNEVIPGLAPAAPSPFGDAADEVRSGGAPPAAKGVLTEETKRDIAWLRFDVQAKAQEPTWRRTVARLIEGDRKAVERLANRHLREAKEADPGSIEAFLAEFTRHMDTESKERWLAEVRPLIESTGEAGIRQLSAELGIRFDLLQPGLVAYTEQHAARLVTQVTQTTKDAVAQAVARGVEKGESVPDIAKRIRETDSAFGKARSELIARTETTQVTNQAQRSSLADYARTNAVTVRKSWLTARDSRVRDEHAALDGETVDIDAAFSDGQTEPGEPNCRCTLLFFMPED
ncbi:MAG: phage portal protein [Gemmatimonadota bacterium]